MRIGICARFFLSFVLIINIINTGARTKLVCGQFLFILKHDLLTLCMLGNFYVFGRLQFGVQKQFFKNILPECN